MRGRAHRHRQRLSLPMGEHADRHPGHRRPRRRCRCRGCAARGALALAVGMRRVRRAQRVVLGEQGQRDLVDTRRPRCRRPSKGLHEVRRGCRAPRLDGRLAGAELALRGAIAHRALVRYDAYNELSGRQSMSIALLDDERSGIVLSCIHHRDQARVYAKQVYGGQGELELSPEEAEAVRLALAAGARRWGSIRRPSAVPVPDAAEIKRGSAGDTQGRLSRSRGDFQRGGAALQRCSGVRATRPARKHLRHGRGAAPREIWRERSCRSRTRSTARSASRSTCSPTRRGEIQIVGETLLTVSHSLIAARALEVERDRHGPSPSRRSRGSVRGSCARGSPTHGCFPPARPPRPCGRSVEDARPGRAALGTRLAAEIYGGTVLREGVPDRDDNETRFVWLARPGEGAPTPRPRGPRRSRRRRRRKTSLVFWGPGADSPGWLVRCLDEFARREINLAKIESRPRRERLGQLHVLRRPRRR